MEESQFLEADFVVRPQAQVKLVADFGDPVGLIASGERAAEETLPQIQLMPSPEGQREHLGPC